MNPVQRKAAIVAVAISIAGPFEGLRNWAYLDPVGIPTICFGATRGVKLGGYKTTEQCKTLFTEEMRAVVDAIDKCQPGLPDTVLAGFSSAAYNLGEAVACDTSSSTAARYLKAKRFADACRQLVRWNKATVAGIKVALPGLTARREKESELCLSGLPA